MSTAVTAETAKPAVSDLLETTIGAVREWRWVNFSDLPRSHSPYEFLRAEPRWDGTDKRLIEAIDSYDAAAGVPEPERSLMIRAQQILDNYKSRGLNEEECVRLKVWLASNEGE